MFFKSPSALIYLRKSVLEFYFDENTLQLQYPQNIVENLEIIDVQAFEKLVGDFFTKIDLKVKKAAILLSEEIVFKKTINNTQKEALDAETKKFLDSVPFDPDKIAIKKISDQDQITVYAVNKDFYQSVIKILETVGWKVLEVMPAAIFKDKLDIEDDELDTDKAKKIISCQKLILASNILTGEEGTLSKDDQKTKKPWVTIIFIILFFLSVLIIFWVLIYQVKLIKIPVLGLLNEKPPNVTGTIPEADQKEVGSTSAQISESSESASVEKDKVKIQVLNGSGIAGQATKVSEKLKNLGYKDIEVGNAEGARSIKTVVIFRDSLVSEVRNEIMEALMKDFGEISTQDDIVDGEFDVLITTGRNSNNQ